MMNTKTFCSFFAGLVILAVGAVTVYGNLVYGTGFESPTFNTGQLSGQDGWISNNLGTNLPVVQSSLSLSGSQAGYTPRGTDTGSTLETWKGITGSSGLVEVDIQLRVDDMASSGGFFDAFYIYQTSFSSERATIMYFRDNGNITVFDGGSEQTVGTWTRDTWHDVEFLFDTDNQLFDLSIDGSPVASNYDFLDSSVTNIAGVAVQEYGGLTGGGIYYDDLSVNIIPEPTTMSLIALAGLVLLGRRQFKKR